MTRVGLGGRSPASFGLAYSRAATAPAQVASRHYASTGNAGLLAASHQARLGTAITVAVSRSESLIVLLAVTVV